MLGNFFGRVVVLLGTLVSHRLGPIVGFVRLANLGSTDILFGLCTTNSGGVFVPDTLFGSRLIRRMHGFSHRGNQGVGSSSGAESPVPALPQPLAIILTVY